MVDGVKNGTAPKAVTTYMEEQSRRAFESGKYPYMRNWPYAYALGEMNPKVKGKIAVSPFPSFEGAGKGGVLGGHNLVISSYSKTPKGAVTLIDYLTQTEAETRPVTPVYPQVSQAIYKNVNQALSGQQSPQDALKNADSQINKALSTF